MRRPRTLVTTFLLTIGLATAAFAGIAAAGELSKKEYKAEINDLCAAANEDLNVVFEEIFTDFEEEPTPEQQQAAADAGLPIFRQMLDDIEDLEGPNALKKKVDKLVDGYRDVADEIEDDPSIVFSSDPDAEDPFVKPDKQAKKLGLDDCVQSG